ncbi:MAG: serine/threonine-protein kinase, partial [Pseudomonadota bacterium]
MSTTRIYDRWEELAPLCFEALDRPAGEVDAFCREACAEDPELLELLRELLASVDTSDVTVKASIAALAQDLSNTTDITGMRVGAYRLSTLIGRGGMGDVYLASRADGAFDKQVAIKVVRSRRVDDVFSEQFRRERQVLASLNHPSIPALLDAGQLDDGRLYFIGEFVDGVPISEYCDRHQLDTAAKLQLIERVCGALQHAHSNLVLHLDIKPDNVLVQADGTPSLLDFGIARLANQEAGDYRAFTPGYASPEQICGSGVNAASDVF